VGQPLERFALLEAGTHRYLRYKVRNDGARLAVDIWSRTISFETREGKPALHIVQRWDQPGAKVILTQDSWFEPRTFRPLTHIRHLERDGVVTIGGYDIGPTRVLGLRDLPDNQRKDFDQPLPEPSYNFEYDMELLQALPLAAHREFNIAFYDPGVDKPGRYVFKVSRADRIAGPDGRPIDCWVLTADYNTGKVLSHFWFAKRGQTLIREEQIQEDGALLVKTLLPPESTDARS
jgi:hypothetical protein